MKGYTFMSNSNKIIKFVLLSFLFLAVDFCFGMLCRTFITLGTVRTDEILGKPNIPLLISMSTLSKILLLIFFLIVKSRLPLGNRFANAYLFIVSYLVIFFIPTLIGMNAYDFSGGWHMLTSPRLRNLCTMISDCSGTLLAAPILGLIAGNKSSSSFRLSKKLAISMLLCAIVFSAGMYYSTDLSAYIFDISNNLYPTGKSFTFNVLFYAPFAITGLGIPLINQILNTGNSSYGKGTLRIIFGVFVLLWMPLQMVVVAFGISALDGLVFVLFSIIPIIACFIISSAFIKKAPLSEYELKNQSL